MNQRTKDKILEIERFLDELSSSIPDSFEEYLTDFKERAFCERYFEKIIGACVDLAFLVIKENGYKKAEEDKEAFEILKENNLISEKSCEKLKDAKSMRNILAHEYGEINDELVFLAVSEELIEDVAEFLKQLKDSFETSRIKN